MDNSFCKNIEKRIHALEQRVKVLTNEYNMEKAKSEIYKCIIENNTDINLNQHEILSDFATETMKEPEVMHVRPAKSPTIDKTEQLIDKIKTSKVYNPHLMTLKQIRMDNMKTMPLEDYIKLCNKLIGDISIVFEEKGFTQKKIAKVIINAFTSLELRLVRYGSYYNENLSMDESETLNKILISQNLQPKNLEIINYSTIFRKILNYGSVIKSIKSNLERVLVNTNGYNNIIYVNSTDKLNRDPYSFYFLERIEYGLYKWSMDCRLEMLTNVVIDDLLPYLISCFRNMYRDVFSDNDYRKDYVTRCQLTEFDMQQLYANIKILCDKNAINKILKDIILKNCTYVPGEKDKLNITSDDINKEAFNNTTNYEKELETTIYKLFDNISKQHLISLKN